MNPAHVELALEKAMDFVATIFAENEGLVETTIEMEYARYRVNYLDSEGVRVRTLFIEHPFMHELIKGLDDKPNRQLSHFGFYLWRIVADEPNESYEAYAYAIDLFENETLKAMLTATVDQLLDAYYRTLHGKEKS